MNYEYKGYSFSGEASRCLFPQENKICVYRIHRAIITKDLIILLLLHIGNRRFEKL
jgi:hypothetical protein